VGEHPSGINQGRGSNADRSCCDTVHTVLRIYGAASTVLHYLLAYPRAVLLVLLERDLLYILRACYSIGERVYLIIYTVAYILPTSARTGTTGLRTGVWL